MCIGDLGGKGGVGKFIAPMDPIGSKVASVLPEPLKKVALAPSTLAKKTVGDNVVSDALAPVQDTKTSKGKTLLGE